MAVKKYRLMLKTNMEMISICVRTRCLRVETFMPLFFTRFWLLPEGRITESGVDVTLFESGEVCPDLEIVVIPP
jgi:hypothetical protein